MFYYLIIYKKLIEKQYVIIFALVLQVLFSICKVYAGDFNKLKAIKAMQKGDTIIFLRHSKAPKLDGNRDINVNFDDCSTQRNLNKEGKLQSLRIGNFFKTYKISFHKVLSSPFCRCIETAKLANLNYEVNNLASNLKSKDVNKRINEIKKYIKNEAKGGNIIFVTHFNVGNPITKRKLLSGEMIVMSQALKFIGSIFIPYW